MTNVSTLLVGFGMFGSFILIPHLAEAPHATRYGFGLSATGAGLLMLPGALVMLVAGPFSGRRPRVAPGRGADARRRPLLGWRAGCGRGQAARGRGCAERRHGPVPDGRRPRLARRDGGLVPGAVGRHRARVRGAAEAELRRRAD